MFRMIERADPRRLPSATVLLPLDVGVLQRERLVDERPEDGLHDVVGARLGEPRPGADRLATAVLERWCATGVVSPRGREESHYSLRARRSNLRATPPARARATSAPNHAGPAASMAADRPSRSAGLTVYLADSGVIGQVRARRRGGRPPVPQHGAQISRGNSGGFEPTLAANNFGRSCPKFGQCRPNLVELGPDSVGVEQDLAEINLHDLRAGAHSWARLRKLLAVAMGDRVGRWPAGSLRTPDGPASLPNEPKDLVPKSPWCLGAECRRPD